MNTGKRVDRKQVGGEKRCEEEIEGGE